MSLRIHEKQKNKNHFLRGEIVTQAEPPRLRMDLRATTLGVYIGSLLAAEETTKLLLARQRKFYEGPSGPEFLWNLAKVPLDPSDLQRLIWGEELPEEHWQCQIVHGVEQKICSHRKYNLKVTQDGLELQSRKFHFEARAVDVRLNLDLVQTKVERPDEVFNLSAPEGFSVHTLD